MLGLVLSIYGSNPSVHLMQRPVTLHSFCQTVHLPSRPDMWLPNIVYVYVYIIYIYILCVMFVCTVYAHHIYILYSINNAYTLCVHLVIYILDMHMIYIYLHVICIYKCIHKCILRSYYTSMHTTQISLYMCTYLCYTHIQNYVIHI